MPLNIPRPPNGLPADFQSWASSLAFELERFGRELSSTPALTRAYAGYPKVETTPLNLYVSKTGSDSGLHGLDQANQCLTIAYALNLIPSYYVNGGNVVINLGSGDWAEDITINGRLWGDLNYQAIPNIGTTWPSMVVFNGNGASNTTISGTGNYGGTLIVSNGATVGLKNLKITGNKNGFQSPIFCQLGGYVHIFTAVEIGAAAAEQLHCENAGSSIQIWENYTLSGGGNSAFAVSDHGEILVSAGVGTVSGTPAYATAFMFGRSGGGIQFNIDTPFSGAATGTQFKLVSNAYIEIPVSNALSDIPGDAIGVVQSGGRIRIGGSGYVTVSSSTGTGGAGTTTVSAASGPSGGVITITAAAGAGAIGVVTLAMPWAIQTSDGSFPFRLANVVNGTGAWPAGSNVMVTHSTVNPSLTWRTGDASALVNGSTYLIIYNTAAD